MAQQRRKLSIIIPYYNTKQYADELLSVLDKQVTSEVQVILIDDGSKKPFKSNYKWLETYRQENAGVSVARNNGLDHAKGKYIAFIDSDDLVADNYITTIINKIDTEEFDYLYMSWKTLPGGWKCDVKLNSVDDEFPPFNLCCWNRVYKKTLIGKTIRFNPNKLIAEDAEFIRDVQAKCKKKAFISEYMYYYRSDTPDSLTKRFAKGELSMPRIVYNYSHITPDMEWMIEEVKEFNKTGEVIILTDNNELKELEQYAMVTTPIQIKGTELRGEPTALFTKIEIPIKTNIVIWTDKTYAIGGIETWIYSFCMNMKDLYDITILYNEMDQNQIRRLREYVRVQSIKKNKNIITDVLIVSRISDTDPINVQYKKKVQMVHCCKLVNSWAIPSDNDYIVPVSQVVSDTYPVNMDEGERKVIHNFNYLHKKNKVLRLISATRLTFEKGEDRMIKLATLLNENNIPFIWTIFAERSLKDMPKGMVFLEPTLDIQDYIADSDYLVQLSDSEGYCYSIFEALSLGVPIISTPLPILDEMGIKDGFHGHIIPFDMENVDVKKIYNSKFEFEYVGENEVIMNQWKELLGNLPYVPKYNYNPNAYMMIKCRERYHSKVLNKIIEVGEIVETDRTRGEMLIDKGYAIEISV